MRRGSREGMEGRVDIGKGGQKEKFAVEASFSVDSEFFM